MYFAKYRIRDLLAVAIAVAYMLAGPAALATDPGQWLSPTG